MRLKRPAATNHEYFGAANGWYLEETTIVRAKPVIGLDAGLIGLQNEKSVKEDIGEV